MISVNWMKAIRMVLMTDMMRDMREVTQKDISRAVMTDIWSAVKKC